MSRRNNNFLFMPGLVRAPAPLRLVAVMPEQSDQIVSLCCPVSDREWLAVRFYQVVGNSDSQLTIFKKVLTDRDEQIASLFEEFSGRAVRVHLLFQSKSLCVTWFLSFAARLLRGDLSGVLKLARGVIV